MSFFIVPTGFEEAQKGDYEIASDCLSVHPCVHVAVHPSELCGTHISATDGPIHTNSILIEVSPCVGVRYLIYSNVGEVMGCPRAALGALWAEVLSVLAVASMGDRASMMPC